MKKSNSKRMHILILGPSIFEGMAGTRRLQNNLLPLLKSNGVRINNLVLSDNITRNNPLTESIEAIRVGYNISNPLTFVQFLHASKRFIKLMFSDTDKNILYVYDYPTINNIGLIKYARNIGYMIVFDIVEDSHFSSDFKSWLSFIKNTTSLYYLKNIEKICDGCIMISSHLYRMVQQYSGKKPLIKIPISVNPEVFSIYEDNRDKDNVIRVFYGGSFGPKDGLKVLLNALKIVSLQDDRVRLVLTGKGAKRHMDRVFSVISEMGIEELIDYKGFLSNEDYYKTMMTADIFCMNRIDTAYANAGFPFKLGEMLATGKPVIATTVGEVGEYLDNESALLTKPGDPEELAKAILFLVRNPQKALAIGVEGKRRAIRHFNASKISQEIFEFLSNI